jgi:hypothetical protein
MLSNVLLVNGFAEATDKLKGRNEVTVSNSVYQEEKESTTITGAVYEEIASIITVEKVENLVKEINDDNITINWGKVSGVTSYEIEVDGKVINNGDKTTYIHEKAKVGVKHSYRVRAIKEDTTGPWSDEVTVIIELNTGDGTEENPYLIRTKEQLNNIKNELSAYYKIVADIDIQGEEWDVIGGNGAPFTGSVDGQGHKIKN